MWGYNFSSLISLFLLTIFRSNFVCDNKSTLIGLSNGHLRLISWNAEVLTDNSSILFILSEIIIILI
jgi:hypothetical protein